MPRPVPRAFCDQRRGINHARLHVREDFAADAPRICFSRCRKAAQRHRSDPGSFRREAGQARKSGQKGGSTAAAQASEVKIPHPEERRLRRVSKDEGPTGGLMVRDAQGALLTMRIGDQVPLPRFMKQQAAPAVDSDFPFQHQPARPVGRDHRRRLGRQ